MKPTVFKIYIWKTNRPTFLGRIIADGQRLAPIADLPATGIEGRAVNQPGVLRKRVKVEFTFDERSLDSIERIKAQGHWPGGSRS